MHLTINTFADFLADFPYDPGWLSSSTEEDVPGKELSDVLVNCLRKEGINIEGLDADVTGREIHCLSGGRPFTIRIFVDDVFEMQRWNVQCFPSKGQPTRLTRGSADSEFRHVLTAVHQALKESDQVRDVRWFPFYDAPEALDLREAAPTPSPSEAALRLLRSSLYIERACTLLGLCLGGWHGFRMHPAALDKIVQWGGRTDIFPVEVVLWGAVGTLIGAFAGRFAADVWRGVRRVRPNQEFCRD